MTDQKETKEIMVGTVVGESTTQEFRMAVTPGQVSVQDLVAVDAQLQEPDGQIKSIRIWAKVESIERINPLFPRESGQELADLQVNPFDTVISMSREMITAVCRVLGYEEKENETKYEPLKKLRYPPQPATPVYRPRKEDLQRIIMGSLRDEELQHRRLDLGWLATRRDVDLFVDGHPVVARHVAILAMTGAGKSWTARRIIEELALRQYPIIIFDPHGEYTGLEQALEDDQNRVRLFYGRVQPFEEDVSSVIRLVGSLGSPLSDRMEDLFDQIFSFAREILRDESRRGQLQTWLQDHYHDSDLARFGLQENLFGLMYIARYASRAASSQDQDTLRFFESMGLARATSFSRNDGRTLEAIEWRVRSTAFALQRMEHINRRVAPDGEELPSDVSSMIAKGRINIINLSGYSHEIQASIYTLVLQKLFDLRIRGEVKLPFFVVVEEAHNFVPLQPMTDAEKNASLLTRTIASEGRKFGIGLMMISQRPSRLDQTALSQCNSFIIMRLVNPADQKFVRDVIETVGEEEARLLPDLDVGEALISGQCVNFPVLARIKPPRSRGARVEEDLIKQVIEYQSP